MSESAGVEMKEDGKTGIVIEKEIVTETEKGTAGCVDLCFHSKPLTLSCQQPSHVDANICGQFKNCQGKECKTVYKRKVLEASQN